MASSSAMFTALSGMNANARSLDVIGNNIANTNTTGFKSSRSLFSTAFSRTLSMGTPPGDVNGGTNPIQIGLGVTFAGTQRDFGSGTISTTGNARDLAIEGNGLFVISRSGEQLYTRDGGFTQDSLNNLVTSEGDQVLGYGVDDSFAIVEGELSEINIPIGTLSLAEATTTVRLSGNLDASGNTATQGSRTSLIGSDGLGLVAISSANPPPSGGNRIEPTTRLVDLEDPELPSSGTPLFASGEIIDLTGAEKGGKRIQNAQLAVSGTTTVQDLLDFLSVAMGINTDSGTNPDGRTPGVTLDAATGEIIIDGNVGTINDLSVSSSDLRILDSDGSYVRAPFQGDTLQSADGESVRTTFVAYDSLGDMVSVDVAMVLESKSNSGTTWRYFAESNDDTSESPVIGTGTVLFGTDGQLTDDEPIEIRLDRDDTGAVSPLDIELFLSGERDNVTALASNSSQLAATYRDGAPIGTLTAFNVGTDGTISGAFTNGLSRTLGQVVLATFANYEGLADSGGGKFRVGPNSGGPIIAAPGELGAGSLVAGAKELSNVDLSEEFIAMIFASTGYSASSRVIQTGDQLMQRLITLTS